MNWEQIEAFIKDNWAAIVAFFDKVYAIIKEVVGE